MGIGVRITLVARLTMRKTARMRIKVMTIVDGWVSV